MAAKQPALGIDLGGTKILAGVVDAANGDVLATHKKRTHSERGPKKLLERVVEVGRGALEESGLAAGDLVGVGIGAAGQIDKDRGVVVHAPNFGPDFDDLPLRERLTKEFEGAGPVAVANDLEIAAEGELRFGAGKDHDDFVCVFCGTGVGGAIMRDGERFRGAAGTAGELGHITVQAGGRICGCGGRGHLEAYASRTAVARQVVARLKLGQKTVLTELVPELAGDDPNYGALRSGALRDAAKQGDKLAIDVLEEAADFLAAGLASIINTLSPKRIILGGGLVEAVELYFDRASRRAVEEALEVPGDQVEIVHTGLGDDSGIVGAAALAAELQVHAS